MPEAGNLPPPEAEPQPKKPRSLLMGCLTAALVLLCAFGLFAAVWAHYADKAGKEFSRQAARALEEAQASRPAVPEEENAASLYVAAFALYVAPANSQSDIYNRMSVPEHDYRTDEVARHLADNKAYLDALREAAARPRCQFGLDYSQGMSMRLGHLQGMRAATRFLAAAARHAAQSGRPAEALELLALGLRVARDAGGDGPLICHMVQTACEGIVAGALGAVLNECEPDAAAVERMLARLDEHLAKRGDLAAALRRDKLSALVTVEQLLSGKVPIDQAFGMSGGSSSLADLAAKNLVLGLWRGSGLAVKDARNLSRLMDEFIAAAEAPFPEALAKVDAIENRLQAERRSVVKAILKGNILPGLMLQMIPRTALNEGTALAKLHAARLALGCRLYRLKFGKYPEKLAELAEKFPERFKALPADPFSGKPFLYKRTEQGCVVWSVGEDRKDDGGAVAPPANAKSYVKPPDVGFELKR